MPFVVIEWIREPGDDRPGLARELADACSPAFPPEHREVWLRVHPVAASEWAINGRTVGPPYPVFVTVVREENPVGADLQTEVRGLTAGIARTLGRPPESIVIEYAPSARGRLAFGGQLLE